MAVRAWYHGTESFDLRNLTPEQLMEFGMADLAYVKPIVLDGQEAFSIHAADGSPMAMATDRTMAVEAIVQHEMVPALVH